MPLISIFRHLSICVWMNVRVEAHECALGHGYMPMQARLGYLVFPSSTLPILLSQDLSLNQSLLILLSDWKPENHSNFYLPPPILKLGFGCSWDWVFLCGCSDAQPGLHLCASTSKCRAFSQALCLVSFKYG